MLPLSRERLPRGIQGSLWEGGEMECQDSQKILLEEDSFFFPNKKSFTKVKTVKETRCSQLFYYYFFLEVFVRDQPGTSHLHCLPSLRNPR